MTSTRLASLTTRRARIIGIGLIGAGLVSLLAAYLQIGHSNLVVDQLALLFTGALGGLFLIVLGGALAVTAELRRRCEEIDAAAQAIVPVSRPAPKSQVTTNGAGRAAPRAEEDRRVRAVTQS